MKRLLKRGADELVERGWLAGYEFVKIGDFHRVRFSRSVATAPIQLELLDHNGGNGGDNASEPDPLADIWAAIVARTPKLDGTQLISIENGTATVSAGFFREWIENRLGKRILKELQQAVEDVTTVCFVA